MYVSLEHDIYIGFNVSRRHRFKSREDSSIRDCFKKRSPTYSRLENKLMRTLEMHLPCSDAN